MYSRDTRKMAKKQSTSKDELNLHKNCIHCCFIKDQFLSNTGKPIMGRCAFSKYMFLLNEVTECEDYKTTG